ncbi:MAG: trypsin-like peptidase domain-containing protein [Planctomycetota bacterium]|jgi:S1-C subfamily serine protease
MPSRWILWVGLLIALVACPVSAGDGVPKEAKAIEENLVNLVARVSRAYVMIGGGSGVVITPDGWMLTNNHVIAQQRRKRVWTVMLPIHKPYKADLVGRDQTGDIALLKIRNVSDLPHVPLGDSDALKPGHLVVALGNPYSHAFRTAEPTVTFGIVSAVHRNQWTYSDAIQTDAPLNPGNSGGPLINLREELVGINGRVRVRFGSKQNTGVGLAIPSNQIRRFLPLLRKGDVYHGKITELDFKRGAGRSLTLEVASVKQGSPAEAAGFRTGDRILTVDGQVVWNHQRFEGAIHAFPEGETVSIGVDRGGREVVLEVTLTRWKRGVKLPPLARERGGLGAKLVPKAPVTGGAEIKKVYPNTAAAAAELKPGDIILAFEGNQVLGPGDLRRMIKEIYQALERGTRKTRTVTIKILRGLEEKEVRVTLSRIPPAYAD